jgi:regulator of replication initiation timing
MWKKLYELLERLATLSQRVSRHDQQVEELRREVRELTGMLHRLAIEVNRLADRQTAEREKMELWVENQMLRFEKRLPATHYREGDPPAEQKKRAM